MVSLGEVTILEKPNILRGRKHARKSTLPSIKGVNNNSLSLLIDQPDNLMSSLAPLSHRGSNRFGARNNSVQFNTVQNMENTFESRNFSTSILPGTTNSIVNSARREAKGLNHELNDLGSSDYVA